MKFSKISFQDTKGKTERKYKKKLKKFVLEEMIFSEKSLQKVVKGIGFFRGETKKNISIR